MKKIELTEQEWHFIIDNALNGLWYHCHQKLEGNLGEVDRKNTQECKDLSSQLMNKIQKQL